MAKGSRTSPSSGGYLIANVSLLVVGASLTEQTPGWGTDFCQNHAHSCTNASYPAKNSILEENPLLRRVQFACKVQRMTMNLDSVRKALDSDELEPCFQPVVELHTGCLTGFEILARWKHPEFGLILPENFISLAEADGLVGRLMRQILREAFLSAPLLPASLVLAVNISPFTLQLQHGIRLPFAIGWSFFSNDA